MDNELIIKKLSEGARAGCDRLRCATVLSREEQAGKELNPLHPWRKSTEMKDMTDA